MDAFHNVQSEIPQNEAEDFEIWMQVTLSQILYSKFQIIFSSEYYPVMYVGCNNVVFRLQTSSNALNYLAR